ncbi:hypothetical protein SPRG_06568 [Saprolegnia parasitica CBS 223.65]|uniref:Arrestin C-terminal-like domain-containing protein n=1 Tax=Saprolegnia parasitica (strain CBS 223.65) TaxID=695850 RepID=A0A067CC44_SAPPC|nr:hypothetical protein SPRG_06568 [Saprolegnia parasitica CBS 223.65]KDO28329.1 hypothetical protein SPRG_06568 [Saprolegnia parasitica CBS 223.65]|eukprot:XP_012200778.1 hypothetical protein SPRG_06568 [Saprolegnia parasitica CBS 223.65]
MGDIGQFFGSTSKGSLTLAVENPYYMAGDVIVGALCVVLAEPLQCTEIAILIVGEENVEWRNLQQDTDHRAYYNEYNKFFQRRLVLDNSTHELSPGQYTFPFQYPLPSNLPGSYDNGSHGATATIAYSLQGIVSTAGAFARDLKHTYAVRVYRPFVGPIGPAMAETTKTVRTLGLFRKGTCHVRVVVHNNASFLGDSVMIETSVTNTSASTPIKYVSCKLVRSVTLRACGREHVDCEVFSNTKMSGVNASDQASFVQTIRLASSSLWPTTEGDHLSCRYFIELKCSLPWCPDAHLRIPLTLVAGPLTR